MTAAPDFGSPAVEASFLAFLPDAREGLLSLRSLIFDVAARTQGVGRVEEALRWGQPAHQTPETRAGSTIRLGAPTTGGFALYVHRRTTLIAEIRAAHPEGFAFEGSRAVLFRTGREIGEATIRGLVARALTYRRR